jgi:hypothetical protein
MKTWKLAFAGIAVSLVPATAFAHHVANCCGDWWCCLMHLGCC